MKTLRPSRSRGGILVLALLCSSVAVLGLTYWIMTIGARSRHVDTMEDATKRRLARANGRTIAFRYLHSHVLPGTGGNAFSRGVGDWYSGLENYEWGGVRLAASWAGSPLGSNTGSTGINRISPGDRSGFGLADASGSGYDLPIQVLDGSQSVPHRWQGRSYSQALAGDLLVVHAPADPATAVALTGTIQVNGRAHFYNAGSGNLSIDPAVTFNGYSSQGPGLPSLVNSDLMVTNFPPLRGFSWAVSGVPVAGRSNVIWEPTSPGYSLRNKVLDSRTVPAIYMVNGAVSSTGSNGYNSDGLGKVTIDLGNSTLDSVVVENAQNIELVGQTTPLLWSDVAGFPTVLVVVRRNAGDTFTPATVTFRHKNNRRLVFAFSCEVDPPAPVAFSFPEAADTSAEVGPEWRGLFVLEQTPVVFSVGGNTLHLTGGLSTDRSVTAPASPGALRLFRDLGPVGLTTKSPRRTWAEGFRTN
ncbi:MAG: hypothetical protein ACKV19_04525 [Verrucomicrobiales bacterium]